MASVVLITPDSRAVFFAAMEQAYEEDGCGVCEQRGSDIAWFNHQSIGAHTRCFTLIKKADDALMKTIHQLFKHETGYSEHNCAHRKAIEAIKLVCGDATIMSYFENK